MCHEGFTLCGGSCWRLEDPTTVFLNHSAAADHCASLGAQLAVPSSAAENQCAACSPSANVWLGITGGATLDTFQGPDGPLTYTNWADDSGDLLGTCELYNCVNCVYMIASDGKWRPLPCDWKSNVLCQRLDCCAQG